MSEGQLSAFLATLKADTGLQEKLKGAVDLNAAILIAKEAGIHISMEDWVKYQANQTIELSDEELEAVAGGLDYGSTGAGACHSFKRGCQRATNGAICPGMIDGKRIEDLL